MTKPFHTLLAGAVFAVLGQMAPAQETALGDIVDSVTPADRPASVFTQPFEIAAQSGPAWMYHRGVPFDSSDPVVMERSIDIAIGLGVLGLDVRPYRIAFAGPGYVGVLPAPVPEGWVVIRRCMERDTPDARDPLGHCLVLEMRQLLGNPNAIAWD